jgi:endonuclease YncB( thermonuclease family)
MPRTLRLSLVGLCLATLALAQSETPHLTQSLPARPAPLRVLSVVDGDTLRVEGVGLLHLAGIDAPELDAPYGPEASTGLRNMLLGELVTLEFAAVGPGEQDGRRAFLRRVPGGLDVNRELVRQGYARAGDTSSGAPPGFQELETAAHDAGRGLWGATAPAGGVPGDYLMFRAGSRADDGAHELALRGDHWFERDGRASSHYQWEQTADGLVVKSFRHRWVFRHVGGARFAGCYTGPDEDRLGQTAMLVRIDGEPTRQAVSGSGPRPATVYITRTGEKYHRAGCLYLGESRFPVRLDDARFAGYEPCTVCVPPE